MWDSKRILSVLRPSKIGSVPDTIKVVTKEFFYGIETNWNRECDADTNFGALRRHELSSTEWNGTSLRPLIPYIRTTFTLVKDTLTQIKAFSYEDWAE